MIVDDSPRGCSVLILWWLFLPHGEVRIRQPSIAAFLPTPQSWRGWLCALRGEELFSRRTDYFVEFPVYATRAEGGGKSVCVAIHDNAAIFGRISPRRDLIYGAEVWQGWTRNTRPAARGKIFLPWRGILPIFNSDSNSKSHGFDRIRTFLMEKKLSWNLEEFSEIDKTAAFRWNEQVFHEINPNDSERSRFISNGFIFSDYFRRKCSFDFCFIKWEFLPRFEKFRQGPG